jgi:hypothetical protein
MRKDITIPVVENVYVAAMQEWNDDFMEKTWYAYLVNDSDKKLETVIVVSNASGMLDGEMRKTSMLRHAFTEVLPDTAVKIEMIEESVLALDNSFMVTFFIDNTLYDKNYIFRAGTINTDNVQEVPVIYKDGVLVK